MQMTTRPTSRGFSLVELMVSMAIGLVLSLIIYQVVGTFEGIKRTTASGANAELSGAFSLTSLERDVRGAGWGLPSADIMPCAAFYTYYDTGTKSGAVPNFPQTPVRIADGGNATGASDSLTMLWGSSVRSNVRDALVQTVKLPSTDLLTNPQPITGVGLSQAGGFVWLTDDSQNCVLLRISAADPGPVLKHAVSVGTATQYNYNAPDAYMTGQGWPATFDKNPRVFDAGTLTQRTYSIAGGALTSQDYFSTIDTTVLATNIVALKAQYGIANAGSQAVNNWVSAINTGVEDWSAPTAAQFKRIKAVRIAVVARSTQRERPPKLGDPCDATKVAPTTWPGGPAIDLSNDPNWQCYRYRVFQTVVPLRNVLWANLS